MQDIRWFVEYFPCLKELRRPSCNGKRQDALEDVPHHQTRVTMRSGTFTGPNCHFDNPRFLTREWRRQHFLT